MPTYPKLSSMLGKMNLAISEMIFEREVLPYMSKIWLDDYSRSRSDSYIVQVTLDEGWSYLFDIPTGRLVAAWGVSRGRHGASRPASRMAGHPLSAGPQYHRGHAIPHTLGGGTDINLVAQLGSVNIGPFRPLERRAVATPGSLYYTYWIYEGSYSQTPTAVEQGLLVPRQAEDIRLHRN